MGSVETDSVSIDASNGLVVPSVPGVGLDSADADVPLKAFIRADLDSASAAAGGASASSSDERAFVTSFSNGRRNNKNKDNVRDTAKDTTKDTAIDTHHRRDSLPSESEVPKRGQSHRGGERLPWQRDVFDAVPSRHQRHHDDAISQGYDKGQDFDWQMLESDFLKGNGYSSEAVYSFRFVMLSRYVGKFIGRHGAHIKNIVHNSGVISISVEQDYIFEKTNQVVNVYGDRDTCDSACYEILKFLFFMNTGRHAEDCPDSTVQLMLLANDDYCGMLIGRDGRSLRQMRQESDTRISFAKLLGDSRFMELYPERVVFVSGNIRNVVLAQSEISAKQFEMRLHETDCWQGHSTRRPNIFRTMQDLDNNTICDIIVENDVAGAVIGRRGANIKTIMTKSQALVSVLPKINELDSIESKRYARIAGTHEAVFRASYMVFLYVTRAMSDKPKMDFLELDSQLFVPALSVGHIIGKHGHRVRNIEAKTDVKIYVLNAPQPPPSPSGSCRSRVKITGNFWNTQAAIREVLKIVDNISRRNVTADNEVFPVRQRRASLSTARELTFRKAGSFSDDQAPNLTQAVSGRRTIQQQRSSRTNGDTNFSVKVSASPVHERSEDTDLRFQEATITVDMESGSREPSSAVEVVLGESDEAILPVVKLVSFSDTLSKERVVETVILTDSITSEPSLIESIPAVSEARESSTVDVSVVVLDSNIKESASTETASHSSETSATEVTSVVSDIKESFAAEEEVEHDKETPTAVKCDSAELLIVEIHSLSGEPVVGRVMLLESDEKKLDVVELVSDTSESTCCVHLSTSVQGELPKNECSGDTSSLTCVEPLGLHVAQENVIELSTEFLNGINSSSENSAKVDSDLREEDLPLRVARDAVDSGPSGPSGFIILSDLVSEKSSIETSQPLTSPEGEALIPLSNLDTTANVENLSMDMSAFNMKENSLYEIPMIVVSEQDHFAIGGACSEQLVVTNEVVDDDLKEKDIAGVEPTIACCEDVHQHQQHQQHQQPVHSDPQLLTRDNEEAADQPSCEDLVRSIRGIE